MNQIARRPMSLDEFLTWERAQEEKFEFDGVGPVAMTGGTLRHRIIADNLTGLLKARLLSGGCLVMGGDAKVLVAGRSRYPDVVVTCVAADLSSDVVPEPVLVVEVLSQSTTRTDRIAKLDEYRRIPGIQYYLILEQDAAEGILFTRDGDGWHADALIAPIDLVLPALGVTLPLADAYLGVIAPD